MKTMTQADKKILKNAYDVLESPGFAIQVMNKIGKPLELGMNSLPKSINKKVEAVSRIALTKSAKMALFTMSKSKAASPSNWLHRTTVWATGFGGGFLGIYGTLAEIPISTSITSSKKLALGRIQTRLSPYMAWYTTASSPVASMVAKVKNR